MGIDLPFEGTAIGLSPRAGGSNEVSIEMADGSTVSVSGALKGKLRYNATLGCLEISTNGGAYKPLCSPKFTFSIEKLGAALSGGAYLKMRYAFYASASFVRVYENGVQKVFGVDWGWNPSPNQAGLGVVADLVDGVQIFVVNAAATYRLEVDEVPIGIAPPIMLWRSDGQPVSKSDIRYRINGVGGSETLSSITQLDQYGYRAAYTVDTIDHYYGDRLGCGWFEKAASIPGQWGGSWRLEVYHVGGRHHYNKIAAHPASSHMDTCFVPVLVTATNEVDLTENPTFIGGSSRIKGGNYVVRLRDTATNRLTAVSTHKFFLRKIGIRDNDYSDFIGWYNRSGVR